MLYHGFASGLLKRSFHPLTILLGDWINQIGITKKNREINRNEKHFRQKVN